MKKNKKKGKSRTHQQIDGLKNPKVLKDCQTRRGVHFLWLRTLSVLSMHPVGCVDYVEYAVIYLCSYFFI